MPVKVAYDRNCEFCSFVKEVVERYDDRGEMIFIPNRYESTHSPDLTASQADRIAILDDSGNRSSEGIDTVIFLSRRIKVLFPVYPILRLAKLIGVGQISYDLIAKNRLLISRLMKRFFL